MGCLLFGRRFRTGSVKKVGNGGDKLSRREWLTEKHTVRNPFGGPFLAVRSGHIDNGHGWVDLSSGARDFPTISTAEQIDVRYESSIFGLIDLEKRNCFFARGRDGWFKTPVSKGLSDHGLNELIVFDDQNNHHLFQITLPAASLQSRLGK